MKISSGTIARTVILILALVNQVLSVLGYKIIPIEDGQINDFVTIAFTIGSALAAWWKNNSFTEAAIEGDKYKDIVKEQQNEHN
mgnify:FL=1